MSRRTIGESPFDNLVNTTDDLRSCEKDGYEIPSDTSDTGEVRSKPSGSQRLTVKISDDIIERAKNAVYWTRGLTLAKLTEDAIKKATEELERTSTVYDDLTGECIKKGGEEFPRRREELKSGRPVR